MSLNKTWTFTESPIGPPVWKDITGLSACGNDYQSPINIVIPTNPNQKKLPKCDTLCDIKYSYKKSKCIVNYLRNQYMNDVKTLSKVYYLELNNSGSSIVYNNSVYVLESVTFFVPALHTFNDGRYSMEAVLAHKTASNSVVCISVFLEKSPDFSNSQDFMEQWVPKINNNNAQEELKKGRGIQVSVDNNWTIDNLLPINRSFYLYKGSGVAPPCFNDVTWILLRESVTIPENLLNFFIIESGNDNIPLRPLQPIQDRIVYVNTNSNNPNNLEKDKVYIKCKKIIEKPTQTNIERPFIEKKSFFEGKLWKAIKWIFYIFIYIFAIFLAIKFVKWLFSSGTLDKIGNLGSSKNKRIRRFEYKVMPMQGGDANLVSPVPCTETISKGGAISFVPSFSSTAPSVPLGGDSDPSNLSDLGELPQPLPKIMKTDHKPDPIHDDISDTILDPVKITPTISEEFDFDNSFLSPIPPTYTNIKPDTKTFPKPMIPPISETDHISQNLEILNSNKIFPPPIPPTTLDKISTNPISSVKSNNSGLTSKLASQFSSLFGVQSGGKKKISRGNIILI